MRSKLITGYFPMPQTINVDLPMHELQDNECPWASNMKLGDGVARKRAGMRVLHDFSETIKGYYPINNEKALVITDGTTTPKVYLWDYLDTFTVLTVPSSLSTYGDIAQGYSWSCCLHVDITFGAAIILTNGNDPILTYDWTEAAPGGLDTLFGKAAIDANEDLRAKFCASLKGALYLAHTLEYNTGTSVWDSYPIRLRWSLVGDASTWDHLGSSENMENFPQNGMESPITSLVSQQEYLLMGKIDMLWQIQPYTNFTCLWDSMGVRNDGCITTSLGKVLFISNGNLIVAADGSMLSKNIDTLLRSAVKNLADVYCTEDRESHQIYISAGPKVFMYDALRSSWSMYTFSSAPKVLGRSYAMELLIDQDVVPDDLLIYQTTILAEENQATSLVFSDGTKLKALTGNWRDAGVTFDAELKLRWDCCQQPDVSKYFRQYTIQALPSSVWSLYVAVSESGQEDPDYELAGTITCNERGFGAIDVEKFGVWHSAWLKNSSTLNAILQKVGFSYTVRKQ